MNELPPTVPPPEFNTTLVLRPVAPRPREASERFQPIEQLLNRFDQIDHFRDCA